MEGASNGLSMVNYINKEWPCTPEEVQSLKVEWYEGLLAEVGIHGHGSVDKLFQALPSLPNEPLPPLHKPKLPAVTARLTRQPLPPVPRQVVDVDIPELRLDLLDE